MKGVIVALAVKVLKTWLRKAGTSTTVLAELSPAARSLLEDTHVLPSTWYPYESYLELMLAIHQHVLGGRDHEMAALAARGAPIVYAGSHRNLIRFGDPGGTLRDIGAIWSICHSFGKPRAEVRANTATVEFHATEQSSTLEALINAGWVSGVIEVAGARRVEFDICDRPADGSGVLTVDYRWE